MCSTPPTTTRHRSSGCPNDLASRRERLSTHYQETVERAMDSTTRKELTDRARFGRKQAVAGAEGIAVTSHPIVTRVAVDTLRAGGNAADAALAASVAQTVVEPHMTTICGVLSLLYYDASTGQTTYLNGSMTRPADLTSFAP